jgi:hypothetical protein
VAFHREAVGLPLGFISWSKDKCPLGAILQRKDELLPGSVKIGIDVALVTALASRNDGSRL